MQVVERKIASSCGKSKHTRTKPTNSFVLPGFYGKLSEERTDGGVSEVGLENSKICKNQQHAPAI